MNVRKAVSIEIGMLLTKVCYMDYGHKQNRVYKSFVFSTPENTVEDAYIRDRETFAGVLKEELKKQEIKCKDFVFTLASNKILSREIIIPYTKPQLIAGIIESEKKEYFPMDISGHVLTYTELEHIKTENQLRLMVYAAPVNLIKNYQNLSEAIGCRLVALDYVGNSVYQWIKRNQKEQQCYFLQINEQSALFTINDNGVLALQRNMNFGTETLTDVLQSCRTDKELSMEEAQDCLIKGEYDENEKEKLEDTAKALVGNVSRVLEFYTTKNKNAVVDKITATGKGINIEFIKRMLTDELKIPVETVGLTSEIEKKAGGDGEYLACIGASYPSVNFLEALYEVKEKEAVSMNFCIALLVLAIIGCAAVVLLSKTNYDAALRERTSLNNRINELAEAEIVYNEYIKVEAAFTEIKQMDDNTYNPNERLHELIVELENKLPSNITIRAFSSTSQGITMSLAATSKEEAAKTLLQLRTIELFSDVYTGGIVESNDDGSLLQEVTFTVTCTY